MHFYAFLWSREHKSLLLGITKNLINTDSQNSRQNINRIPHGNAPVGKESHHSQSARSQEVYHSVSIRYLNQLPPRDSNEWDSADQPKDSAKGF